jgi:hypothetical protein
MRRHRLFAVVAVCLLALGGCTATTNSTAPPGLSETGVTDVSALVEAHTEALQSTSFTVRSNRTMRSVDPAFTVSTIQTWNINTSSPIRGSVVSSTTASGEVPDRYLQAPDRTVTWRNGRTTVERVETNGTVSQRRLDFLNTSIRPNQALHRRMIAELTTRSNATVERVSRDGTEWYRVSASLTDTGVTTNASMTLLVTPAGIVREIRSTRTVRYRSGPRRITHRVRIGDIGTTNTDPPRWAVEAFTETEQ